MTKCGVVAAEFLCLELTVRNEDKKARFIPSFELVDNAGAQYDEEGSARSYLENGMPVFQDLNPNVEKRGAIVFDVPRRDYRLKLKSTGWSSDEAFVKLNPSGAE